MSAEGTPESLRGIDSPVATFAYPESAARALGLAAYRGEWLRRPAGSVRALAVDSARGRRIVDDALASSDDAWLEPGVAQELLAAYGIPLVAERHVSGSEEAVAAARSLGYPVVVKTAAAGAHKTEKGGVALDLADDDAVREAAERIGGELLVQPMLKGGVELLAGVVQDPVFGPIVAFGPGGVFAELIGGAEFRIAPITDVDAEELVGSGKAGRLVHGFRGGPAADADALAELVQRLSQLAVDLPELAELDLNPVLGLPTGCVAVDMRVRVRRTAAGPSLKSW